MEILEIAFIPRHDRTRRLNPPQIPHQANIWDLRSTELRSIDNQKKIPMAPLGRSCGYLLIFLDLLDISDCQVEVRNC